MNSKKWKLVSKHKKIDVYKNLATFIKKENYDNKVLIRAKNLTHSFKNKVVYKKISFEIFENEKLAFLGPNGAGKTLTVSTLCGYEKQKEGDIDYLYQYETSPYEKLSVQFQDLKFPTSLTPKDLIEFSLKLSGNKDNDEDIIEAIETFEIDKILNTKMSKLSGGQQQRVNVLISMIGKPKILFLDEFTTGLDISIKNKIQNYILDFCKKNNITLVVISHDIDCIEEMVDRIIIIADKKIFLDAYKKDIIEEFGSVKKMLKKYIIT